MQDSGTTMASATSTRKRKAASTTTTGSPPMIVIEGSSSPEAPGRLETLLTVPLEIIFRQIPCHNSNLSAAGKPLLTRAEARCLLRIQMLANEFDQLVSVSKESLQHRIDGRTFGQKLLYPPHQHSSPSTTASTTHPFLRPLLPLLSIQGSWFTNHALNAVEEELERVATDLGHCSRSLRQFSEHNWTLSESLWDTVEEEYDDESKLPPGALLAFEKRRLSDLEQELCNRIDALVMVGQKQQQQPNDSDEEGEEDGTEQQGKRKGSSLVVELSDTSMADFCSQLWNQSSKDDNDDVMDTSEKDHHDKTTTTNNPQASQPKLGLFSYPETIQGLDQRLLQLQKQNSPNGTPMTLGAVDDQSKPQGIPRYSAEEEEEEDDETVCNNNDEDQIMRDAQQKQGKENSQKSTRSVVSDHSDADPVKKKNTKKKEFRMPTQSQVQHAGEALALLASIPGK